MIRPDDPVVHDLWAFTFRSPELAQRSLDGHLGAPGNRKKKKHDPNVPEYPKEKEMRREKRPPTGSLAR